MSIGAKIRLLAAIFAIGGVTAQDRPTPFTLGGYVKNLQQVGFTEAPGNTQWSTLLHNRLNFKYLFNDAWYARLEFRNRAFYGDLVRAYPGLPEFISSDPGWADLSWNLFATGNALLNITIDRALVQYSGTRWEVTLGRQRINWGRNLIWNPNDLFNSYNFLDFDYEERPGSDAVRMQYFLDAFSRIELAAKKGNAPDDRIVAALYGFHVGTYDLQLITGLYQHDWVFGGGWSGNLKNAGFKGEVSYFLPLATAEPPEEILSASVSADYSFVDGWYLHGSYLYLSQVIASADRMGSLVYLGVTPKSLMPFRHSAYLQCSREITPALQAGLSGVYSPTGQSLILIPYVGYALAENWEFDFTGQGFFEFETGANPAASLFLRIRWSY